MGGLFERRESLAEKVVPRKLSLAFQSSIAQFQFSRKVQEVPVFSS